MLGNRSTSEGGELKLLEVLFAGTFCTRSVRLPKSLRGGRLRPRRYRPAVRGSRGGRGARHTKTRPETPFSVSGGFFGQYRVRDSNPCYQREKLASWTRLDERGGDSNESSPGVSAKGAIEKYGGLSDVCNADAFPDPRFHNGFAFLGRGDAIDPRVQHFGEY